MMAAAEEENRRKQEQLQAMIEALQKQAASQESSMKSAVSFSCILARLVPVLKQFFINVSYHSIIMGSSRENLSSGFPTRQEKIQSPQLQRLARNLKFCCC